MRTKEGHDAFSRGDYASFPFLGAAFFADFLLAAFLPAASLGAAFFADFLADFSPPDAFGSFWVASSCAAFFCVVFFCVVFDATVSTDDWVTGVAEDADVSGIDRCPLDASAGAALMRFQPHQPSSPSPARARSHRNRRMLETLTARAQRHHRFERSVSEDRNLSTTAELFQKASC